jgi:hypothetical protein
MCFKHHHYLYTSDQYLHNHSKDVKRVFTYETNNFESAKWLFNTTDCGKTFTVMNKTDGGYLFLVDGSAESSANLNSTYKNAVTKSKITEASYWCLEIDNGALRLINPKKRISID